ncbi:FLYWCH zinc finger domain-containing protein [Phthorimaea operculella]|nr:FLYWCH zinc finger domain-containing protein [Phthorimaea operculella]
MDEEVDQELVFLKRGRGAVLLSGGFQYHIKKKYVNGDEYWKCAETKKTKCVGSLTIKDRNVIQKRVPHSVCNVDIAKNEVAVRMNNCKERIKADITVPIPKIFEETVSGLADDGYDLLIATPKFTNVKTAFYNYRNNEAGTSKMFYTNSEQVEVPPIFEKKFLFADYYCNGIRILVFGNEWSKEMLISGKVFFLDGTFNICPEPFTQLLTIHCDIGSTMEYTNIIPVLYALLPDKKTETYVILLRLLQSEIKKSLVRSGSPIISWLTLRQLLPKP